VSAVVQRWFEFKLHTITTPNEDDNHAHARVVS